MPKRPSDFAPDVIGFGSVTKAGRCGQLVVALPPDLDRMAEIAFGSLVEHAYRTKKLLSWRLLNCTPCNVIVLF